MPVLDLKDFFHEQVLEFGYLFGFFLFWFGFFKCRVTATKKTLKPQKQSQSRMGSL